eukprot:scaffold3849_cov264-Ochromonas_danica.AAC.6
MEFMKLPLPVLYAYDVLPAENDVTEVTVGFTNYAAQSTVSPMVSRALSRSVSSKKDELIVRPEKGKSVSYECFLYDNVAKKKSLFFFDTIRKIYLRRLATINADHIRPILGEHFTTEVVDYYDYDINNWLANQKHLSSSQDSALPTKTRYLLTQLFAPKFCSYLAKNLTIDRCKGYNLVTISGIQVQLTFRERIQQAILDHETYSTFVGSRQPYFHFRLVPSYTTNSLSYVERDNVVVGSAVSPNANASLPLSSSDGGGVHMVKAVATNQGKTILEMLETIAWRSQNVRKLLVLFISSSLQLLKAVDLSSEITLDSQNNTDGTISQSSLGTSGSDVLLQLSEETKKALAMNDDYLSYQQTMQYVTSNMQNNSPVASPPPPPSNGMSFSPDLRFPSPVPPSRKMSNQGNVNSSTGYSRNFSVDEGRQEESRLAAVLSYLFEHHHDSNGIAANGAPGVTLPEGGKQRKKDRIENFMEHLSVVLSFQPQLRLSFVIKLWQQVLHEISEGVGSDDREEEANSNNLPFFAVPPINATIGEGERQREQEVNAKGDEAKGIVINDTSTPIYARQLWEDILQNSQLTYPNLDHSILQQKLQMIDFCHSVKGEGVHCLVTNNAASSTLSTDDDKSITSEERVNLIEQLNNIGGVWLARRVPLTSDLISLQQHIAAKYESRKKASATNTTLPSLGGRNPFLQYHVCMPALLTDMISFRKTCPDLTLDAFMCWYGLHDLLLKQSAVSHGLDDGKDTNEVSSQSSIPIDLDAVDPSSGKSNEQQHDHQSSVEFKDRPPSLHLDAPMNSTASSHGENNSLFEDEPPSLLHVRTEMNTPSVPTHRLCVNKETCMALQEQIEELWMQAAAVVMQNNIDDENDREVNHDGSSSPPPRSLSPLSISSTSGDALHSTSHFKFSAKKEIEKALLFLEKIPINALILELLVHTLRVNVNLLYAESISIFGPPPPPPSLPIPPQIKGKDGSKPKEKTFWSRFNVLQELVQGLDEKSMYIRKDAIIERKQGHRDDLVTATVIVIKQAEIIVGMMENVEHLLIRAYLFHHLIECLVPPKGKESTRKSIPRPNVQESKKMINLSEVECGAYTLTSDSEAAEVLRIMKSISAAGSGGHNWHSYDGREVGMPNARKFVCRSHYLSPQSHTPSSARSATTSASSSRQVSGENQRLHNSSRVLSPPPTAVSNGNSPIGGVKLDFSSEEDHEDHFDDSCSSSHTQSPPADVEMVALVDQQQMRLAFLIKEMD